MNDKYVLIKPQENCGMCGYIWQTIRAMYHNPNKKYYIDFANSIYKSNNKDNVWDYFFQQPHTATRPIPQEIEKEVGIIFDQESEFIWREIRPNTTEEIQKRRNVFGDIIQKYIKLQPNIQQKVDSFVETNFKNKRILGIHLRGTDHPEKKHMDVYLQAAKDILPNYDVVFISSDEYDRFRLAEIAFSHKAVSYNSIRSKTSNIPLHSHPYDRRYQRNDTFEYQYKIAEDVIIEAYLMSKVNYLMCCSGSNVNYFARAINPNLEAVEL